MFLPTSEYYLKQVNQGRLNLEKKFMLDLSKVKGSLNKYQHLMIRDMAYFEALFNEMLN